jgi:hypothetical protein
MKSQKYKFLVLVILVLSFSIFFDKIGFYIKEDVFYYNKNSRIQTSAVGSADWYRTWGGLGEEVALDMVIDEAGNIYLAGYTYTTGLDTYDMILLKYNSSGSLLFNKTWGGNDYEECYAIELDNSENIYLAGSTSSYGAGNRDMCIVKFDNTGNYLWNKTWGDTGGEACYDIEIDESGNLYLAGTTNSFGAGANDMCVVKFDASGNYIWNKTWGGAHDDRCNALDINIYDEIYLGGTTRSFGDLVSGDIALVKYLWSEDYDWERIWAGGYGDVCGSLITDAFGNAYLGGRTSSYGEGGNDALIIKYERSGNQIWNLTWGTSEDEYCLDITIHSLDYLYFTGAATTSTGYLDCIVVKVGYLGEILWQCTWGLEYLDYAYAIALDSTSNIYIAGGTENSTGNPNVLLVKNPKSLVSNEIPGYEVNLLFIIIIVAFISIVSKDTLFKKKLNTPK